MDEYEGLKQELQELFPTYVECFRNLEWLEGQLEGFHLQEQKNDEEIQQKMKSLQRHYQEEVTVIYLTVCQKRNVEDESVLNYFCLHRK
jgi:hypothetical protein